MNVISTKGFTLIGMGSLLGIAYVTLYPFDFFDADLWSQITINHIAKNIDWNLSPQYAYRDIPRNVLLFVPLGFSLAGLANKQWARSKSRTWLVAILGGGFLSIAVEIIQLTLPLRFSSIADVAANGLGAWLGAILLLYWPAEWVLRQKPLIGPKIQWPLLPWGSSIIAYSIIVTLLLMAYQLQHMSSLQNWNRDYPLLLGNERTGNRPWIGEIASLYGAPTSLPDQVLEELRRSGNLETLPTLRPLNLQYQFNNSPGIVDLSGTSPNLKSATQLVAAIDPSSQSVQLTPASWLVTESALTQWIDSVRDSNQFFLAIQLRSMADNQVGPARILSISSDPWQRNLTIGQEGTDLIIRLRTPFTGENGRSPELVIPEVMSNTTWRSIILDYDTTSMQLIVLGQETYRFELTPEVAFFLRFSPINIWQLRLSGFQPSLFHWLFITLLSILVSIPILVFFNGRNGQFAGSALAIGGHVVVFDLILMRGHRAGLSPSVWIVDLVTAIMVYRTIRYLVDYR